MEMNEYVRKPFVVNAIQITEENIAELAQHIGTLQSREGGGQFIKVDRTKVPTIDRVFPGFWLTMMGDNTRCYSECTFARQFTPLSPDIKEWVDFVNKEEVAAS